MCTPRREVSDTKPFVGFGASELLSFGLSAGLLDAVVLACDGAGTVIVTKPALVQGIGGRMSGLVKTVPYEDVIRRIEENGGMVIDKEHAGLDQTAGVAKASAMGYRKIAVTVAVPEEAKKIRSLYPDAMIFGVHVTGLSGGEAEVLVSSADLVTSCASGPIREVAGKKALLQAGVAVPIFAVTKKGKDLIIEKIRQSSEQVLVKTTRLPQIDALALKIVDGLNVAVRQNDEKVNDGDSAHDHAERDLFVEGFGAIHGIRCHDGQCQSELYLSLP